MGSGLIAPAPELPQPRIAAAADAVDAIRGGVRLVVVLMVVLAAPEGGQRDDLRHHPFETARLRERVLRRLRRALLNLVGVEDDRAVLRSVIAELPGAVRGIDVAPIRVEELVVRDLLGVVDDL